MNTVCIPGIGRGSSPGPNVGSANVALQGGICEVVIWGRVRGGNKIVRVEGVGVGRVACVGVGVLSRLIGSAKKVLGRKRPYGAQNPTLGRLGPRIR